MTEINKNNLFEDLSPYLQQHKKNPVNWQVWSNEVLEIAKKKKFQFYLVLVMQAAIGVMLWHMKVLKIKKQPI
tara:strand:- start:52 stop:270 length:219 start_codon:yes stop_codon:yes gene_type:complete